MGYRVITDYGASEGMKFDDGEFETVDDAVKAAQNNSMGFRTLIVKVIDWEAKEK